ncbi:MAG: SDR family oxidoreductase [Lentilactobacillus hilgardii]|uniref:SDR family oxidoreductase n=1 Tax=Lentilactobacillus hilgardii TaxID=1588 RepID=UPI001CC1EB35|nr:SDR family oxidoreductase [Lentilactobacillus hilgardii]MBZ2201828.1 3-oxoacyl-ACP reductase [Lentilactobacillus hilgardii]MBZ2204745.1 3-oxoacyl-ACP reductase [Lentilactobacillus hilgardii]MCT3399396.1 SDR family oxidoreductase [Lentilactobacillus hilgardii]
MLLRDKVALITGSSRGIGATIAKRFAKEGAIVAVNFLKNKQKADEIVQTIINNGGQAFAIQADVRDLKSVHKMIQTIYDNFNGLDIIVNNALNHYTFNPKTRKTAEAIQWQDYQAQLDGSVQGAFNCCHEALPMMASQSNGRVINMASNLVEFPLIPYHDYITAKTALIGFTRSFAAEVGALGIQVNAVAPGLTYPTDSSIETQNDVRESIINMTPTKRLTVPDDVAGCALFLASNLAGNITGQCLYVDGGLVMH